MDDGAFELVDTYDVSKYATHDIGKEFRRHHPSRGWCLRCGLPNTENAGHFVSFDERSSCSAVCVDCWKASTEDERVEYHRALFRSWLIGWLGAAFSKWVVMPPEHPEWIAIEAAVRTESKTGDCINA